jgi:hypothetical protein
MTTPRDRQSSSADTHGSDDHRDKTASLTLWSLGSLYRPFDDKKAKSKRSP